MKHLTKHFSIACAITIAACSAPSDNAAVRDIGVTGTFENYIFYRDNDTVRKAACQTRTMERSNCTTVVKQGPYGTIKEELEGSLPEDISTKTEQALQLQSEIDELTTSIAEMDALIDDKRAEFDRASEEIDVSARKVDQAQAKLDLAQAKLDDIIAQLEDNDDIVLQEAKRRAERDVRFYQSKLDAAESEHDGFRADIATLEPAIIGLEEQLVVLKAKQTDVQASKDRVAAEADARGDELAKVTRFLDRLESVTVYQDEQEDLTFLETVDSNLNEVVRYLAIDDFNRTATGLRSPWAGTANDLTYFSTRSNKGFYNGGGGETGGKIFLSSLDKKDYTVSVEVHSETNGWIGLNARSRAGWHYSFLVNPSDGRRQIRFYKGSTMEYLATGAGQPFSIVNKRLEFEVKGDLLVGRIDGEEIIQARNSRLVSGNPGLVGAMGSVTFDNFAVAGSSASSNNGAASDDDRTDAPTLSHNRSVSINGQVESKFEFTLRSEQRYEIKTTGNVDTKLKLKAGSRTLEDDDGGEGNNARLTGTLSAGTYSLSVLGYNDGTRGTTNLLSSMPLTLVRQTPQHPVIEYGASRSVSLSGTTYRNFTFQNSRSRSVAFYTEGSKDTFLRLEDSNGNLIEEDDDDGGGRNASIYRSTLPAGTYVIKVRGYDGNTSGSATVRIGSTAPRNTDSNSSGGHNHGCGCN